jgi:DNA polymerase-3 subunit delta
MPVTKTDFRGKKLYYQQVLKEIREGEIRPVYLFFGEEILLADNLLSQIKKHFLEKAESELNYFVRYGSESGADAVISLSEGMGLFSNRKIILLKDAQSVKQKDLERLGKVLEKNLADICIILQAPVTSLYQTRLKKIESLVTSVNLLPLRDRELRDFVRIEFRKFQKEVSEGATDLLLFIVGTQLADLTNQISIISQNFIEKEMIDVPEIEQIAAAYVTQNIFEYTRYVGERKSEKAVFVLHNLLESGMSPQYILTQLLRHFSILWQIHGYQRAGVRARDKIAKNLNIFPKYFDEYYNQSREWKTGSVLKVLKYLHQADFDLKDSGKTPKITLDILSYKILNS